MKLPKITPNLTTYREQCILQIARERNISYAKAKTIYMLTPPGNPVNFTVDDAYGDHLLFAAAWHLTFTGSFTCPAPESGRFKSADWDDLRAIFLLLNKRKFNFSHVESYT